LDDKDRPREAKVAQGALGASAIGIVLEVSDLALSHHTREGRKGGQRGWEETGGSVGNRWIPGREGPTRARHTMHGASKRPLRNPMSSQPDCSLSMRGAAPVGAQTAQPNRSWKWQTW